MNTNTENSSSSLRAKITIKDMTLQKLYEDRKKQEQELIDRKAKLASLAMEHARVMMEEAQKIEHLEEEIGNKKADGDKLKKEIITDWKEYNEMISK